MSGERRPMRVYQEDHEWWFPPFSGPPERTAAAAGAETGEKPHAPQPGSLYDHWLRCAPGERPAGVQAPPRDLCVDPAHREKP